MTYLTLQALTQMFSNRGPTAASPASETVHTENRFPVLFQTVFLDTGTKLTSKSGCLLLQSPLLTDKNTVLDRTVLVF